MRFYNYPTHAQPKPITLPENSFSGL